MFRGIKFFSFRDQSLGKGIEDKHARRAAFRLRIDVELRDEIFVQPGGLAPGDVQVETFGALRRERKFQHAAEGIPVRVSRIFPAAKPFQSVSDVADFVAINFFQQLCRVGVADRAEVFAEELREVQISLLEREAEAGDVINRVLHRRDAAPEIAAHGKIAELHAAAFHPLYVEPCVLLFVLERLENAFAEGGWRVRKFQQHERHEFGSEQLVVRKKVQQLAALGFLFEPVQPGEIAFAGGVRFEKKILRTARAIRRDERRAGMFVRDGIRRPEFFLQRRGEQNLLGEFA